MIRKVFEEKDLWQNLREQNKKIVLYGMGDGADKIINVCRDKNIEISGVFASDGFAKKKLFNGFEVTTYNEIKDRFDDFTVLLSFATSRQEVFENISRIASEHTLLCPDVPVFGGGLFDSEFVNEHKDEICKVYNMLEDEISKENYVNLLLGKLTGKTEYLKAAETSVDEAYESIIQPAPNSHYVDIGAYNGDTIREYLSFSGSASKITAFEPDTRNFKKLCRFAEENYIDTSSFYNIAAWDKNETLTFYNRSGRNSANTTSSKTAKAIEISASAADNYIKEKVDFINIDAEGSDKKVINGLKSTLIKYRPCVSCAVYHRNEDMFELPLLLKEIYGHCRIYIRHFPYFPAWDTNVYVKDV